MEEYQIRQKYLRHLKKVAQIGEGNSKTPFFSNINSLPTRNKMRQMKGSPKHLTLRLQREDTNLFNTTERIMRDYTVGKQNNRLFTKLMHMNSCIPLKKYQTEYEQTKKYPTKIDKLSRTVKVKYVYFKFFDINFNRGIASSPQDYFKIYSIQHQQKKVLLAQDKLFQLKKKIIKVKKSIDSILKIEGQHEEGIVRFGKNNLMDITRHDHKVGHVVVQFCHK